MYSIVEIGGHQFKVEPGTVLDVFRLDAEEGSTLDLDKVLFVGGDKPSVGAPTVNGASVKAKVVRHARDRKLRVFRRGVGKWRRTRGHRQDYTCLVVTEIADGSGNTAKIDPKSKVAEKYLK